jgi:hypothetical protein
MQAGTRDFPGILEEDGIVIIQDYPDENTCDEPLRRHCLIQHLLGRSRAI